MAEGSLQAPVRHPIAWQDPEFYDMAAIEKEMHRVFDICHGCRRCFNLCDSFPRLFDLADNSPTGELDSVDPQAYKTVVDACPPCQQ
jgi:glycerol-3-phosphate dehydrogenase subunit C